MKIYLPIEVDEEDLIQALFEKPEDDLVQFVKELSMGLTWRFEIEMFKFFARSVVNMDEDVLKEETDGMTFDDMIECIKKGEFV